MKEHFHFIGIGGIGMSGLARILLERGEMVTGSDLRETAITKKLIQLGAQITYSQSASNINAGMLVIYSSAVKDGNPELDAAKSLDCILYHRSDLLGFLMKDQKTLAVAGTHGKTSVSSLLAWVLNGSTPSTAFAVGGIILEMESNGANGDSDYFVAEADESDGSFLNYPAHGAIVTNVEADHLDHYGNEGNLFRAMQSFIVNVENTDLLFYCGDDSLLSSMVKTGISYGFSEHCNLKATKWWQEGWTLFFDADFQGKHYSELQVPACGKHQVLNALSVLGTALKLGMDEKTIRDRLKTFPGVKRRCEKKGIPQGILVLDDYAHHPTEIHLTLDAIKEAIGSQRLIAVMQPHRYSRTAQCLGDYGKIFDAADKVYITDIFGGGEAPIANLNAQLLVSEVESEGSSVVEYVSRSELLSELLTELQEGDVVVTLGAGDITALSGELVQKLGERVVQGEPQMT